LRSGRNPAKNRLGACVLGLVGLGLAPASTTLLAVLFPASTAWAQAADPRPLAPRVVEIMIATAPGAEEAAERSLLGPLRRLGLDVRPARGVGFDLESVAAPGVLVRAFVDLRPTSPEVLLLLVDGPTGQIIARRGIVREGSDEVLREQAAFILASLVEDRLAIEPPRVAAPPPASSSPLPVSAPPASPGPPAASPAAIEVAPFFSAGLLSPQTQISSGGGLAVGLRGDRSLGAWLLARLLAPADTSAGAVELHAGLFSARFLPTARVLAGPSLSLDLGLGAGLDMLSLSATSSGDALPRPSSRRVSAVLSGVVRAQAQISGSVQLFAAALLDADLAPRRYVVAGDGGPDVLLAPSVVRPSLLLGLTFSSGGASP
jgi:hypothetical protein